MADYTRPFVAYRLHSLFMIEVRQTAEFSDWLRRLKDADAVARIVARIRRMEMGNPGGRQKRWQWRDGNEDCPWSRLPCLYYAPRGATIVILLCAGDKRTQRRDIKRARELAEGM
jgi:putative addiction module killer protein